jgi:hypothetical protein
MQLMRSQLPQLDEVTAVDDEGQIAWTIDVAFYSRSRSGAGQVDRKFTAVSAC